MPCKHKFRLFLIISIFIVCNFDFQQVTQRGISVVIRDPQSQSLLNLYEDSWALLIGINNYQNAPRLGYAVQDAQSINNLLTRKFGFSPENITLLTNAQATRDGIRLAFSNLSRKVGQNDRD